MATSYKIKLSNYNDIKKFFDITKDRSVNICFTNRSLYEASTYEQAKITSDLISKLSKSPMTLTETSSGIGGNTIEFAKTFSKITSVELDPLTYSCLRSNAMLLEVDENINFINDNCLSVLEYSTQDVIFMDPPWGGIDYKSNKVNLAYNDSEGIPVDIPDIILKYSNNTEFIVIKTPINVDMNRYNVKKNKLGYKFNYVVKFIAIENKRPLYQLIVYSNTRKKLPKFIKVKTAKYKLIKYNKII